MVEGWSLISIDEIDCGVGYVKFDHRWDDSYNYGLGFFHYRILSEDVHIDGPGARWDNLYEMYGEHVNGAGCVLKGC